MANSKPSPANKQVQYRSAKSGEFTTQRQAAHSPSTHVREVNKVPPRGPEKK